MKPVVNYLANLTKSMTYAAADVGKELMPNVGDFLDSNSSFIKTSYIMLKNPKMAIRRSINIMQESKIYQAIDYGAKNVFEDLRTGNFYNRERENRDEIRLSGMKDDFNDLSEFGIDDDWEEKLKNPEKENKVTTGDLQISETIEKTSAANANATVNAIVSAGEYQAKITKATSSNIYLQNEKLFGGLHEDLSVVGKTIDSIQQITSTALQNIDKNQSDFFTADLKLSQERNAMIKEILEMQRNIYKTASQKEKEENQNKKIKKNRWSDIQFSGMLDFEAYVDLIKNNINNEIANIGLPNLSEDGNMLAAFMTSPLKSLTTALISGLIPATTKLAVKNLDEAFSGIFANVIAEMQNKRNDNKIYEFIAKIFGINGSINGGIDTSKYEKGTIPFDGITRKAIIDVIPSYLRRIEAYLTGNQEQTFDYENGRWINMKQVENNYKEIRKRAIKNANQNLRKMMNKEIKTVTFDNAEDIKSFKKAYEEFQEYMWNNNGRFNPDASKEDNGIEYSIYPNLDKHYNTIVALYKNAGTATYNTRGGMKTVNNRYATKINLPKDILTAKDSLEKQYRALEESTLNPIVQLFSSLGLDTHGKYVKDKINPDREDFEVRSSILFAKDEIGNNIYDYLRNINTELLHWRKIGYIVKAEGAITAQNSAENTNNTNTVSVASNSNITSPYNLYAQSKIDLENENKRSKREFIRRRLEAYDAKEVEKAMEIIAKGKAMDISKIEDSKFKNSSTDLYKALLNLIEEANSKDEVSEIIGEEKANTISKWLENDIIQLKPKSLEELRKEKEKAEKKESEDNETYDDDKEKDKTLLDKIFERAKKTGSLIGGMVGAASEVVSNVANSATKGIYDILYVHKIKKKKYEDDDEEEENDNNNEDNDNDDDSNNKKEYDGLMDLLQDKIKNTFKNIKTYVKEKVVLPFKKWLGIDDEDDEEDFKDRFKDELTKYGKLAWEAFKDGNSDLFTKTQQAIASTGIINIPGEVSRATRQDERKKIISDYTAINNFTDIYDPKYVEMMEKYGLKRLEYGTDIHKAKTDLRNMIQNDYMKYTNNYSEITSKPEAELFFNMIDNFDKNKLTQIAKSYNIDTTDLDTKEKLIQKIKDYINHDDNFKFTSTTYNTIQNKQTESILNYLKSLNSGDVDNRNKLINYANNMNIDNTNNLSNLEIIRLIEEKLTKSRSSLQSLYDALESNGADIHDKTKIKRFVPSEGPLQQNINIPYSLTIDDPNNPGNKIVNPKILNTIGRKSSIQQNAINENRNNIITTLREDAQSIETECSNRGFVGTLQEKGQILINMGIIKDEAALEALLNNDKIPDKNLMLNKMYLRYTVKHYAFGSDAYKTGPAYVTTGEKRIDRNGMIKTIAQSGRTFLNDEAIIPKDNKSIQDKINDAGHEAALARINGEKVSDNPYIPNYSKGSARQRKKNKKKQQQRNQNNNTSNQQEIISETIDQATETAIEAVQTATEIAENVIVLPNQQNESIDISGKSINAKELISQARSHIPEMAAGGLVGGITSMLLGLVGGPLAGAAIGAGASMISRSDFLKDKLFGEKDKYGDRQGGIVSKTIVDSAKKYAPDMFKYGLTGIIPGLITGLGPIPGILAGATIGYLKNNEKFTNKYFGEHGKLTLSTKEKKIIQNMLPGAGKGAIGGLIANIALGAMGIHSFGLLGNMLLGSGIGMMASTDSFKNLLLGVENSKGEREGGLLGIIKSTFDPLLKATIEFKDKLLQTLENNIINPLSDILHPLIHELPRIFGWLPNKISEIMDSHFGRSITTFFKDITSPLTGLVTKIAMPLASGAINLITSPVKLLGVAGKAIRKNQIREHRADYMTAKERIEFGAENGTDISDYDRALAGIGAEGSITTEQAKKLKDALQEFNLSKADLNTFSRQSKQNINNILDSYTTKNGKSIGRTDKKKIRRALENDDIVEARRVLSRSELSENEINELLNDKGLKSAMEDLHKNKSRLKNLDKLKSKKYQEENQAEISDLLDKLGIGSVNFTDDKLRERLIANLTTEIEDRQANGDENIVEPVNKISDSVANIDDMLGNIWKAVIDYGNGKGMEESEKLYQEKINKQENKLNQEAKRRKKDIIESVQRSKIAKWKKEHPGEELTDEKLQEIENSVYKKDENGDLIEIKDKDGNGTGEYEIDEKYGLIADEATREYRSTIDKAGSAVLDVIGDTASGVAYLGGDFVGGISELGGGSVKAATRLLNLPLAALRRIPGKAGAFFDKGHKKIEAFGNDAGDVGRKFHKNIKNAIGTGIKKTRIGLQIANDKVAMATGSDKHSLDIQQNIFDYGEDRVNAVKNDVSILEGIDLNKIIIPVDILAYCKELKDKNKVQWELVHKFLQSGNLLSISGNKYEITKNDIDFLMRLNKIDYNKLNNIIKTYLSGTKINKNGKIKNVYYKLNDFGSLENLANMKLKNGDYVVTSDPIEEATTSNTEQPTPVPDNTTQPESEQVNEAINNESTEQPVEATSAAFGTVPNYGFGSLLLNGLGTVAKSAGKLALKGAKAGAKLAWKGAKAGAKLAWNGAKNIGKKIIGLVPDGIKNISNKVIDKVTSLAGKAKNKVKNLGGKFKEMIHIGNGKFGIVETLKDRLGNVKKVKLDTTDADTKQVVNEQEEEKKQQEETAKAQQQSAENLEKIISPANKKNGGSLLSKLLIGGLVLTSLPIVNQLWNNIIKPIVTPIWEQFIKPGISSLWNDYVKPIGGWILNTALPWFNDNILTPFMLKLPEIIYNGIHNINKIQVDSIGKTNTKSIDYQEYFTDEEKKIVQNNGSYTNSMISKTYLKQIESTIQEIGNSDITNNPDPKRKEDLANRVILYIKSAKQNGASDSDIINSLKKTKLHYEGDYNKIIPAIYNNDEVAINELKNALINVTDLNDPSKGDFKTQVHNTAVNSAVTNAAIGGTAIGALGGGLAAGKIGAALGTTIAPGIGTAIGALLGLGIGALTGKVTGEIASSAGGYGALDDNDDKPLSKYGRYKESLNNKPNILNGLLGGIFLQNAQNDNMIDTSFNESSVLSTIEAAKEGRISIFSSEYWNNDSGNVLSNVYSKAMKMMAIPSIIIKNSMKYLIEDASEFANQFTKLGSSATTDTSAFDSSAGVKWLNDGAGKYGKSKYVKQIDPSVSNIEFNTGIDSEYQTIGDSGCGPAAAVNAIQSMYGRSKSLINAAKFALKNGYKEKNGGTKPEFFKNYFASKGLNSQTTSNKNTLVSNIRAGIPTVLMGQDKKGVSSSTPYGRNPHYVTATGIDSKGRVIIQDPESKYDNQLYSMNDVINKTSFGVSTYGKSKSFNIFNILANILNKSNAGKVFSSFLGAKYGKGKYDAEVWNYLKNNMGFTDAGAAGVIGNMNQESNVDPGNLSDSIKSISDEDFTKGVDNGSITKQQFITGDGTNFSHYNGDYGYGLVQWYAKDVKEWLYDYIKSKNLSIGDLAGQLEFLKYDTTDLRKSRYADMINTLKTTNDPSKAAASFLKIYEVSGEEPGDPGYDNRIKYAKEVYDKLKGTTGTAISDSETAISSEASDNSTNDYLSIFDILKNILNNSNAGKVFNSLLGVRSDSSNLSSLTSASSNNSSSSNTKKVNVSSNKMINDVVSLALKQVGGGKTNGSSTKDNIYNDWWDNGFKDGAAPGSGNALDWCAAFVSWVMRHAGVPETIVPNYRGCTSTGHDYIIKNYGAKAVNTKDAKPGDIMFFSDNNGSSFYHTGLVVNRKDSSTLDTVEGNTGNGDTVSNYTYNVTDSRLYPIRPNYGKGNNNDKPLSKYGRYKESLCNNSNKYDSENEYMEIKINEYKHDQLMQLESIKQKSKYGKGSSNIKDNTPLINTIITILYTIADNTDKLNTIVSILNDKLGINIDAKDINSKTTKETLKKRLMIALNTPNMISASSKLNSYADAADNNGVNTVIQMMNKIASE